MADEESLLFPGKVYHIPIQVKSDNHRWLGMKDSSVAVVSI